MKKLLCFVVCFQLLTVNFALAQQEDDVIKNTQNDMMIVMAAGAGGAVLGLSTLSFYDTPSKHLPNVWTGAALGIIAGVIFVAYNSAQKGSEDLISSRSSQDFSTSERSSWHWEKNQLLTQNSAFLSGQLWQTSF
jgi:hypothetical protein